MTNQLRRLCIPDQEMRKHAQKTIPGNTETCKTMNKMICLSINVDMRIGKKECEVPRHLLLFIDEPIYMDIEADTIPKLAGE